jgi:hypothetical protein
VKVGGEEYRFLVDTGVGVTVVSSALAARSDVHRTGETFTGRRMSGQAVEIPLVRLPTVELGDYTVDEHIAGVADLGEVDGPNGFAGILGLGFFEKHAVTVDAAAMSLTVQPAESFRDDGYEIPVKLRRDAVSVDPFVTLVLPSGREICVEVDTGSADLILDTRYLSDCDVHLDDCEVTTGTDETGYQWTRRWATIPGAVHLAAAPETVQVSPRVQFQDIIHDGLVGSAFLERYRFTVDVSGARLVLTPTATQLTEGRQSQS